MSPKTGRPPKQDAKRIQLTLRIKEDTAKKLIDCARVLEVSRTEVIERGVDKMADEAKKKTGD